jgi:hypothetical protein
LDKILLLQLFKFHAAKNHHYWFTDGRKFSQWTSKLIEVSAQPEEKSSTSKVLSNEIDVKNSPNIETFHIL